MIDEEKDFHAAEINGTCIRQGETILVPADNNILNITGTVELLTAFVP